MDLPTYTNIWRIEKRLYKLYDFRLPMPLPMVQVGVFIGVVVPWVLFLQLVRVPFASPWHVLYLVPPGLVTYLATRPVIEGKRLTELLVSQLRYLLEPHTWCRLAPAHEPERATLVGRVWRRIPAPATSPTRHARHHLAKSAPTRIAAEPPDRLVRVPVAITTAQAARPESRPTRLPAPPPDPATRLRFAASSPPASRRAPHSDPATHPAPRPAARPAAPPAPPLALPPAPAPPVPSPASTPEIPASRPSVAEPSAARPPVPSVPARLPPVPVVRAPVTDATGGPHDVVRNALTEAEASFPGPRRVMVLGCTGGAGQTTTALMLGHALARCRAERCVAVDVNPGVGSLARRARLETPETLTSLLDRVDTVGGYPSMRAYTSRSRSRLEVIASDDDPVTLTTLGEHDYGAVLALLDRYYKVTLLDPAAAVVARVLALADQLVLVAPAGRDASRTATMTLEWLRAHGHERLAGGAVMVVNGVSRRSAADAERAEAQVAGRCREVVRIPWDDHLADEAGPPKVRSGEGDAPGVAVPDELDSLRPPARRGYAELARAVVASMSTVPMRYHQQEASR